MKQNLYFRVDFQRKSLITAALLDLFLSLSSWPRMLLEVFIRKNFGERYFSAQTAIIVFIFLALLPMFSIFYSYGGGSVLEILKDNIVWYLYLAAFLYASILRAREIRRLPSVFDFARFSLSTGIIHPLFYEVLVGGKPADRRTIETILEPFLFFILGLLLLFIAPNIGVLLMVCSIMYSLSYIAAYKKGDDFILDIIDEMICNQELVSAFVDGHDSSETRGVHFYGRRPADPDTRRQLAKSFVVEEDIVEAR